MILIALSLFILYDVAAVRAIDWNRRSSLYKGEERWEKLRGEHLETISYSLESRTEISDMDGESKL